MTSCPLFTPTKFRAMCKADVPLTQATPYSDLVYCEIFSSNSLTLFPTEETKFESMHSSRYIFSLPSKKIR